MKKIILTLCCAFINLVAYSQSDKFAAGVNLSYGTKIKNVGIGAKGQYLFTDNIRGEISFEYFFKKEGLSMFDLNANVHYLFDVAKKVKVYPLVGIGYTAWKSDISWDFGDDYEDFIIPGSSFNLDDEDLDIGSTTDGRFAVNLGVGGQYELTDRINLNVEAKYQIISHYSQFVFGVGASYRF